MLKQNICIICTTSIYVFIIQITSRDLSYSVHYATTHFQFSFSGSPLQYSACPVNGQV
jgi:hypothetical protein